MTKNVLDYLYTSKEKFPLKTAVADNVSSMTYTELVDNATTIAVALLKYTGARRAVPIYMDKSCVTLAAFMGVVMTGNFYVLLEPAHPEERIHSILDTLQADIIVTNRKNEKKAAKLEFTGNIVYIEDLLEAQVTDEDRKKLSDIKANALDIDPLYAIFTSGSTGVPKGVVVNHRSVIDFIECFTDIFGITDKDVIGNQAPFDFDVSVKDIYSSLKCGATLQIIPKSMFSFPTRLLDYLDDNNVTTLIWAVSALCIITTLKGFDYKVPKAINKVIFSGEVMPIKHLNIWREYYKDALFANVYGPTEITCNCTYYIIDREFAIDDVLPMGKAFPNERVFLLDENDKLIKNSEADKTGEICVSGTAVTMGYFNNKEKTDSAFVQNPLNGSYNEIIYRTGDLGYYNDNKEMCFSSRKDFQIKHNGHRIELGELDMAINSMDNIQRACCIYQQEENKIYAFYEGEQDNKSLTHYLLSKLPKFMIPEVMINVKSMPLTKNGKIDRKALMEEYNA